MAEGIAARDAELKQTTAALESIIVQVNQLPAMLGAQTSKYIAAGIREVVQDDFRQPVEKAIEGPIRSIKAAASVLSLASRTHMRPTYATHRTA